MLDDTELYIHDDDGFDELFALIEAEILNPVLATDSTSDDIATVVVTNDSQTVVDTNDSQPVTETTDSQSVNTNDSQRVIDVTEQVYKLSHEVVSELNRRIERLTLSPFDRFRGKHRGLGVRPFSTPFLTLRLRTSPHQIGARLSFYIS